MDKEFESWAREYQRTWKDSQAYRAIASIQDNRGLNHILFPIYMQYKSSEKLFKMTRWLVFATWALCLATLLLIVFKA